MARKNKEEVKVETKPQPVSREWFHTCVQGIKDAYANQQIGYLCGYPQRVPITDSHGSGMHFTLEDLLHAFGSFEFKTMEEVRAYKKGVLVDKLMKLKEETQQIADQIEKLE